MGPEQNIQELVTSDLANKTTSTTVPDQFASAVETVPEKSGPIVFRCGETKTDSRDGFIKADAPAQSGNDSGMTRTGPVSLSDSKTEVESKTRHAETQVVNKEIAVQGNSKISSVERDARVTSKEVIDHKHSDTSQKTTETNADGTVVRDLQKTFSDGSGNAVKRGNDASANNIPIANQNNSKGGGALLISSAGVDDRPADICDKKALTSAFNVVDTNKPFNNRSTSTMSHFA